MAARSLLFLTFVVLAAAMGLAQGYKRPKAPLRRPGPPRVPDAVCFFRRQRCCFKFEACGFVVKKVPVSKRCDFKKCFPECKQKCVPKVKKVPYKHCYTKPATGFIRKCRYYYDEHHERKRKCEKLPREKGSKKERVCETRYKYEKTQDCSKKCGDVCYVFKAVCKGFKVVKYAKFCPKLRCGDIENEGKRRVPKAVVLDKGVEVKEEFTDKKVIGKDLVKDH